MHQRRKGEGEDEWGVVRMVAVGVRVGERKGSCGEKDDWLNRPGILQLPSSPCSLYKAWFFFFFFFCVRCDDRAKSSGQWLLGSPPSAVVRQLAPRAWCPLQCLLAKTVGVLSPGVGRSEECAQGFAPQSHIHSGLNQQDLVSLDVSLAHSDQYADGRWWFGSSCQGC